MLPITVQVRDRTLARVGILSDEDLADLQLFPAKNDVGTWQIKLPHLVRDSAGQWVRHRLCEYLTTPGAGIIAALPGGRRFSGPMVTPSFEATTSDPGGTWTITGVSDEIVLADRLAFPDPAVPTAQESSQSRAYDVRTGTAETLMKGYVRDNIGPDASAGRRDNRLRVEADQARGGTRTKSARFPSLLALCQELAVTDGLLFDVVQINDSLTFRVSVPRDLTGSVRMDIQSDQLAGTKFSYSSPAATRVVVLGGGEGSDRLIRERTNPTAEAAAVEWGRVIERTADQRQAEEVEEVDAKGDEILATEGLQIESVEVTPSDANARELGSRWWLGDVVTVNVAGVPVRADIAKIRVAISKDGIYAGATVGDAVGFDPARVTTSRVSSVESRVSSLERTGGSGGTGGGGTGDNVLPAGAIIEWPANAIPANWLLCDGRDVSRVVYGSLFSAIGTTYGAGDGSATFTLPDFRGRVPVGVDPAQPEFDTLGKAFGAKTHALTAAEGPVHTHAQNAHSHNSVGHTYTTGQSGWASGLVPLHSSAGNTALAVAAATATNQNAGGGAAHNNVQPSRAVHFIIKASNGDTPGDSQLTARVSKLEHRPAFSAKGAGNVSASGAQVFTLMKLTAPSANNGGHYSTSTGAFTAPVAGLYSFRFSFTQASNTLGPEVFLFKNGSLTNHSAIAYLHYVTVGESATLELKAGDYLQLYVRNNNGTAIVIDLTRSSFSGELLI